MKIILSLLLSCGACASSLALELVKDGQPLVKIYALPDEAVPKPFAFDPSAKATYDEEKKLMLASALHDLTTYIEKMSGAKLVILPVSSLKEATYPSIIIGDLSKEANLTAPESGTAEGFVLHVTDKAVFILGASPAGTAYGIYELLNQIGCAWVMPGTAGEVIPSAKTLGIPLQTTKQIPSFEIRCPWYISSRQIVTAEEGSNYLQWKVRNKLQINRNVHPLQMVGGHAWGFLTGKLYKEVFAADPEMLALARQPDGSLKRKGPQVEGTNPKVIDLLEKYIRNMFTENKWPTNKEVSISVSPADGVGYSESLASMAAGAGRMDPVSGYPDMTDLLVLLCN
ncbi:MAG: hypothetical protein WC637_05325, partial [Victivallales bacterium]